MDEATKQQLIAAGREDLVEAHEITVSGYAGVMPKNGMIVDRRKHPEAIPARKNTALGIPEPKELTDVASTFAIGDKIAWSAIVNGKTTRLKGDVSDIIGETMTCVGKCVATGNYWRDYVSIHDKSVSKL